MLQNSFRLFTIRGIEVGIHYSWLFIFFLLTFFLGTLTFPGLVPGLDGPVYWLMGVVAALLLFASVLVHELAHSFMAQARGLAARSITLFIFGGVSNLGGEAKQPSTEFLVAIVGPLTSFALAGLSFGVFLGLGGGDVDPAGQMVLEPLTAIAFYLGLINIILGVFNLVPGYPLDGGRVLRAILWTASGSLRRATEQAATVGRLVAWGLFALGLFFVLYIPGGVFQGIFLAAIAWFLHNAASNSVQQVVFETQLSKIRVGEIVRADQTTVPAEITVAELIESYLLPRNRRAMPVSWGDRLVGMVTLSDITKVPAEERVRVRVGDVMGGRERLVTISPLARVRDAVELLSENEFEQLPVMDGDRFVGMLTRADVMRQLQLREALRVEPG